MIDIDDAITVMKAASELERLHRELTVMTKLMEEYKMMTVTRSEQLAAANAKIVALVKLYDETYPKLDAALKAKEEAELEVKILQEELRELRAANGQFGAGA